mmetsp:Transcript_17352/g.36031  ORF Transcript_17352/g.36031 Transcript_17352/m.36031 type:complete len:234 (+) Transcript_17352:322-1023(+)
MKFRKSNGTTPKTKITSPATPHANPSVLLVSSPRAGEEDQEGGGGQQMTQEEREQEDLEVMKLLSVVDGEIAALQAGIQGAPLEAMTKKTLMALSSIGGRIAESCVQAHDHYLSQRRAEKERDSQAATELAGIEEELIKAKVALIELASEKERLQASSKAMKRDLASPKKRQERDLVLAEAKQRAAEKRLETASAMKDALVDRVHQRRKLVESERQKNLRLKKMVRDVEGDWE